MKTLNEKTNSNPWEKIHGLKSTVIEKRILTVGHTPFSKKV